jgi:hypothetical protein
MMFVSLGVWAAAVTVRSAKAIGIAVTWLVGVLIVPATLLLLLWAVNFSGMEIGGGPPEIPWLVAASTLSLLVGGPEQGDAALLIAVLVAAAVFVQLVHMARMRDDRWIICAAMILVPAVLLAATGNRQVYPRYLLGTALMLLIPLSLFAARIAGLGRGGRWAVAVVLAATLLGNGRQVARLYQVGRGQAKSVVEYLRDHSGDGPIVVSTDHPFRHGLLLSFYGRRLGLADRLVQPDAGRGPPQSPQWILTHSQDRVWAPEPVLLDAQRRRYELRRVFPYAGLSGWHTAVYEQTGSKARL